MTTKAFTSEEIQTFRAATKGTTQRIHFNNAGTSLPPDAVVGKVIDYLQEEAIYGGYETEAKYKNELDHVYTLIAQLVNAGADEIAIVENASIAWGIAFYGIDFKVGDVVLTSEYEYVSNLIGLLKLQKTHGIVVKVIPNDEQGNFSLSALEAAISPQTKLIAVTHIPSTAGGMLPLEEIGRIARANKILYLVDACQSVGHYPIDVKAIGCDMLAVTGRKYMRGPRGTGFLYVRKEVQDRLNCMFIDGFTVQSITLEGYQLREDARRFEVFESNRALTLGLGKAVSYMMEIGVDRIWLRIQYLATLLRSQLAQLDGITVHDKGDQLCGIVTFSVKGVDSTVVKTRLAERQINVSVALPKSTLFYMEKNHLGNLVRASIHYYNTEEELKTLCDALAVITELVPI